MAEDLPTDYDVVILGTGMTESILAAASARIGKKVLHLDRRDYYSGQWAAFNWEALQHWIEQQSASENSLESNVNAEEHVRDQESLFRFLQPQPDAYNVHQEWFVPETNLATPEPSEDKTEEGNVSEDKTETEVLASPSPVSNDQPERTEEPPEWCREKIRSEWRRFNIDLAPKLLYSRGGLVELLISSNIARYAEFKSVTLVLSWLEGCLESVPCSRADVFATRNITVVEKRMLMKLLSMCSDYEAHHEEWEAYESRTFLDFLKSRKLTTNVRHYVLHAIAMVTETTSCREGLESCQRFLRSLGRYGNTPFLWPLYGSGEIPQCFCRMCAVYGGIYHLKRGVDAAILDQSGLCRAIVSSGQRLGCEFLVMEDNNKNMANVSRAIFLTNRSLVPAEKEQITLLRFPGRDGREPVTIIEVGSSPMACPKGLFLLHMTTHQYERTSQEDLHPVAMQLLNFDASQSDQEEEESKPRVLWALYFNLKDQEREMSDFPPNVFFCSGPGFQLDFENSVKQAQEIWQKMYPEEEFLPRAPDPEEIVLEEEENPGPTEGGRGDEETDQKETEEDKSAEKSDQEEVTSENDSQLHMEG